jgi:hypothetical protein
MKKIAIIRVYGHMTYDSYNDYSSASSVVQHVTDWQEITDEEFWELQAALKHASTGDYQYVMIEQMDSIFSAKTVKDYQAHIRSIEERRRKEQEAYALKAAEAKERRELKKLEKMAKDREKFKKMAAEMGLKVVES